MVLCIDRRQEGLIRVHDLSQEAENDFGQVSKILSELRLIFKKRNFDAGTHPRFSQE